MGLSDIIRLGLDLEKRKNEYLKNNDKDNYIKFLEIKNSDLLREIQEILLENENLIKKISEYEDTKLSKAHLEILNLFIRNDNNLLEPYIVQFINGRDDYEIAFSELRDWEYVKQHLRVVNINNPRPNEYYFSSKYRTEVLKLLKKNNM